MKQKKAPLRKCIGCNEQKTKKELIRVVKNNQNEVFIDITGKANGRGAYICPKVECLKKAEKRDALSRAFQQKIDRELYVKLEQELAAKEPEIKAMQTEESEQDVQ